MKPEQRHASRFVADGERQEAVDLQAVFRILPADQARLADLAVAIRIIVMRELALIDVQLGRRGERLPDVRDPLAVHVRVPRVGEHFREAGAVGVDARDLRERVEWPLDPEAAAVGGPAVAIRRAVVPGGHLSRRPAPRGHHVQIELGEPVADAAGAGEDDRLAVRREARIVVVAGSHDQRTERPVAHRQKVKVGGVQRVETAARGA